ncbi:sugar porter family MFS transporter [Aspergillus clavatus NRRL 1]|uniref:MFS sugar transporter, putative n=1 Tax=Aspergillus clavatus (strain ATCC 1007 / CBS 513.65 / DSM 816 / NCTC 3887 / NRRL 1 / QM 1276 / 107) TaxID=344612 RepID=A1CDR6_ASPCL|nr:MFS sugar transporter, putative [Aspergillus clavatus NRRL 1]EAW11993.1 MFS sugar transporter, putative [Aspergillus clavatus NRRL 1]
MQGPHDTSPYGDRVSEQHVEDVEYATDKRNSFVDQRRYGTAAERQRRKLNAILANPLAGYTPEELRRQGIDFALKHHMGDEEDIRAFELGAVLAQAPAKFATVSGLTPEEREILHREFTHRWSQPWTMYLVIALCSLSAAVQGMDETVVNGAQIFYKGQFGIGSDESRDKWLVGLVNAAPYLCCAVVGCWLAVPFNAWFGRRGTIFITCCFSAIACLWQGFVNTWWHMFIARFVLGFGIGPKSATVPIYAAETAPPAIRGALVMQWQMWTAFGIMLGYAADLAFFEVPDPSDIVGLKWRIMMGSAMFPAVLVCLFVFSCPESPRWYMSQKRYYKAYESMCSLRTHKIQAARDLYYMHTLLEAENTIKLGQNKIWELIAVPRNRRALAASEIVMFLQQLCGVNVIAYYSSEIFHQVTTTRNALATSFGWGVVNWLFAIPAIYTIDTFGRRNLLLTTFPLMALAMFFTGFSFFIPKTEDSNNAQLACVALGLYLFGVVYSVGEGPVPFTYSAEAYPLYVRSHGMALATATTWFFNFLLAITWPSLHGAYGDKGAFCWYAGWNLVGFVLVLLFMPETKGLTLEELDQVFSVSTRAHVMYGLQQVRYFFQQYILRKNVKPVLLYERDDASIYVNDVGFNAD